MLRALCLCSLLSGCVAGNVAAGALVRPLRVPVIGAPSLRHESLQVTTTDGIALDGWLFRPAGQPRGLVVLLHGKDANRQRFVGAARRFVEQGFAVVAYDQRAHGASTGEFVTYGANEVNDARLIIDTALKRVGRTLPVALIGESLGAAVALQTAAVEPRVRFVVAGAPFADLETIVRDQAPFLSDELRAEAVRVAQRAARFTVADISPEKAASRIAVPTMLLHGAEDTFVPMRHSLRILSELRAPRRFVRLEGVDHLGVLRSDAAWDEVHRFLYERGFGDAGAPVAASK